MTTAAIKQTVAQQSLVGLLLASGLTGMVPHPSSSRCPVQAIVKFSAAADVGGPFVLDKSVVVLVTLPAVSSTSDQACIVVSLMTVALSAVAGFARVYITDVTIK